MEKQSNDLQEKKGSLLSKKNIQEKCPICCNTFGCDLPISDLRIVSCCGNIFCNKCLFQWGKKQDEKGLCASCPMCRAPKYDKIGLNCIFVKINLPNFLIGDDIQAQIDYVKVKYKNSTDVISVNHNLFYSMGVESHYIYLMTKLKELSKGKIGVHNENHNNNETLYQGEIIKDNIVVGKKGFYVYYKCTFTNCKFTGAFCNNVFVDCTFSGVCIWKDAKFFGDRMYFHKSCNFSGIKEFYFTNCETETVISWKHVACYENIKVFCQIMRQRGLIFLDKLKLYHNPFYTMILK